MKSSGGSKMAYDGLKRASKLTQDQHITFHHCKGAGLESSQRFPMYFASLGLSEWPKIGLLDIF